MHGRIYIILKESLKNIPIFGWGAQFYNFIFLARKWETDKPRFRRQLAQLSNPRDPMWLLIFPEGTNLSATTREKSKAWADKQGISDMKHQLLPRSTGLHFCLNELKSNTNWLYDCTIAYEGVPRGQFGQDIFTLRSSFFEGRPPKSVNMYWRRFRISEIPIENEEAFAMWLRNRWTEKDYLLEHFQRHGTFPEGDPVKAMKTEAALAKFAQSQKNAGDKKAMIKPKVKSAKFISTEVKAGGLEEFMSIFGPITTAATALSSGQLDPNNINFDALLSKVAEQQQANLLSMGAAPKGPKSQEAARELLMKASKFSGQPIPGSAVQKMTQNAPQSAANARPLPAVSNPTAGKQLDPAIQRFIENAHAETRQRLARASAPGTKQTPNVKGSIPMTPMETIVTRPLSTIAMQKASQRIRNASAAAGPKRAEAMKKAQNVAATAQKSAQQSKAQAAARPAAPAKSASMPVVPKKKAVPK